MPRSKFSRIRGLVLLTMCGATVILASCSREEEPASEKSEAISPLTNASPTAPESPTPARDGSAITLSRLSSPDIAGAKLPGELGCGFSDDKGAPLLIAMGDAASTGPASAIVKVGGSVEQVAAPGGFDAMVKGVTFTGGGKTVRIELTGSPIGASEAPPIPAKLIYQRADGAERSYAGRWECGP